MVSIMNQGFFHPLSEIFLSLRRGSCSLILIFLSRIRFFWEDFGVPSVLRARIWLGFCPSGFVNMGILLGLCGLRDLEFRECPVSDVSFLASLLFGSVV